MGKNKVPIWAFIALALSVDTGTLAAANADGKNAQSTSDGTRKIVFFGDSITAGLGVPPNEAFPALIQGRIVAAKLPFVVINAGLSGETSAGGLRRVGWVLKQRADVLVIELGANDGLRGLALNDTRINLQGIIDRARALHPQIQIFIAGMQLPPNLGAGYTAAFRSIFPELAIQNSISLIPFLLEGVGGVSEMNQADGIHPNSAGHHRLAENVWSVLGPKLVGMLTQERDGFED